MSVTVKTGPNVTQQGASIIPNASPFNDGVMTAAMVQKLDALAALPSGAWQQSMNMPPPGKWAYPLVPLYNGGVYLFSGNTNNGNGRAGTTFAGNPTNKTDAYFMATDTWLKDLPPFPGVEGRAQMHAVGLPDGNILVCGGWIGVNGPPFTVTFGPDPANIRPAAAILNPIAKTWTVVPPMPVGMTALGASGVLLNDGRVAFFGNFGTDSTLVTQFSPGDPWYSFTTSTVLFNPTAAPISGTPAMGWSVSGSTNLPHGLCCRTKLPSGDLAVFGGGPHLPDSFGVIRGYPQFGEKYGVGAGTWTKTDLMPMIQGEDYMTVPPILDVNGNIVVPGDLDTFCPGMREQAQCTVLPSGKVLISGGFLNYVTILGLSGGAASFAPSGNPGTVLLNGVSGFTAADIRQWVRITGAATAANNAFPGLGCFPILNVLSPTSIEIRNPAANPADANNGAISWVEVDPFFNVFLVRKSAIIYDPAAAPGSQYTRTGDMIIGRADHVMAKKTNGDVLAISGLVQGASNNATTESYNETMGVWTRDQDIVAAETGGPLVGGIPDAVFVPFLLQVAQLPTNTIVFGSGSSAPGASNQPAPKRVYFLKQ